MAHGHKTKAEKARDENPQRAADREGDVLGIGSADPHVQIPKPARKGSGHAIGIDVRQPTTGIGDLTPGRPPSTVDMGAAGDGTGLAPHSSRPKAAEPEDKDSGGQ